MDLKHTPTDAAVLKGIALLNELLALKSQQDGIERAAIGVLGPADGFDPLSKDVSDVAMLLFAAQQAIPLMDGLTEVGRALAARGLIQVDYGDSYGAKALTHIQNQLAIQAQLAAIFQPGGDKPDPGFIIK